MTLVTRFKTSYFSILITEGSTLFSLKCNRVRLLAKGRGNGVLTQSQPLNWVHFGSPVLLNRLRDPLSQDVRNNLSDEVSALRTSPEGDVVELWSYPLGSLRPSTSVLYDGICGPSPWFDLRRDTSFLRTTVLRKRASPV